MTNSVVDIKTKQKQHTVSDENFRQQHNNVQKQWWKTSENGMNSIDLHVPRRGEK